jgi:hypothetical protein
LRIPHQKVYKGNSFAPVRTASTLKRYRSGASKKLLLSDKTPSCNKQSGVFIILRQLARFLIGLQLVLFIRNFDTKFLSNFLTAPLQGTTKYLASYHCTNVFPVCELTGVFGHSATQIYLTDCVNLNRVQYDCNQLIQLSLLRESQRSVCADNCGCMPNI